MSLDNSNPKISSTATAAVTANQSSPSKLKRTPKSKSFVLPPSLPNSNYPSAVDSYLPIGHPVHNIPPPEPGGSIVVVPQNFRAPVTGREVLNLEKPLLRHNLLLSYTPSSSILYPRFLHSKYGCTREGEGVWGFFLVPLAFFNRSISVCRPLPSCCEISLLILLQEL